MILAVFCAGVTALAVLRLVQMLQWRRCQATTLGFPHSTLPLPIVTGKNLPIIFTLRDGTEVTATLRLYGRMGAPDAGVRVWIIYDPEHPQQVEWAAGLLVLLLIIAFAATATVATLLNAWQNG